MSMRSDPPPCRSSVKTMDLPLGCQSIGTLEVLAGRQPLRLATAGCALDKEVEGAHVRSATTHRQCGMVRRPDAGPIVVGIECQARERVGSDVGMTRYPLRAVADGEQQRWRRRARIALPGIRPMRYASVAFCPDGSIH